MSCSSLSPVFSSVNAEAQLIIKRLGRLLGPQGSVVQCVSGGTYLTCADQDAKRLYLWMLLQQRPRQQLEVKHLLYLVSLNKCQAHFCKKKVLIFFIGCGNGGDVDITSLFYVGESPGWRIRPRYAFSFGKLIHFKTIRTFAY